MAFGQQSGPPASGKQVAEIEALLEQAGYASLREARHIYGLTQRQAAGKFSRAEADELVARLEAGEGELDAAEVSGATPPVAPPAVRRDATAERAARRRSDRQAEAVAALPDELLADELVRRGWMCVPPS